LSSKDTAYTSESLESHTDNTYFTEAAGLQALHMLSHTDGSGGESSLVDGFNAARELYSQDKEAYLRLSNTGVYAHASGNDGISIQPASALPTFSHDAEGGHLVQVRWNNADRAGVAADFDDLDAWYDAAGKFDAILSDPKNQYWFQLRPGQLLIFDNWRALHGRAAFTGKRRMCGGYIPRDDFISKYRQTNLSREDIEASTVSG
jgi:trimethyllysine dioxygenase